MVWPQYKRVSMAWRNGDQMIHPQLVAQIRQALGTFIGTANQNEEQFFNTESNCEKLFDYLRNEGIPQEQWIHPNIFAAAFFNCKVAGVLEDRHAEETAEQKALRLEFQDRNQSALANQIRSRRQAETPEEEVNRVRKEIFDDAQARREAAKKAAEDAETKRKADLDISGLPTVAQLHEGQGLSPRRMRALSEYQLRVYISRLRQYETEQEIRRKAQEENEFSDQVQ
jgi:hypothetical protein